MEPVGLIEANICRVREDSPLSDGCLERQINKGLYDYSQKLRFPTESQIEHPHSGLKIEGF